MTKRDRMMRSWLRAEQRRKQFDRHQHKYWYREGNKFREISLMKQYRKRPLVIEAAQWDGEKLGGELARNVLGDEYYYGCCDGDGMLFDLMVKTPEGVMTCEVDDWLIKGVKNEYYPVKPDIFEETYEAVE